jgi:hypothetical protein
MTKILEDYDKGITIDEYDDTIHCDLCYSNVNPPKKIQYIGVGISHVRASDGIRVSYDYDRDGYVIEQQRLIGHDTWSEDTGEWKEVAFVQSWGLQEESRDD